jgi:hypothetical protein
MLVADFPHKAAVLIILGLWPLTAGAANAQQLCRVDAPRYRLQEDTVSWSMTTTNGHSCIHGTRFADLQFDSLRLVYPPHFGVVELRGSGFIYSPNASFHGQDAFSLIVVGAAGGKQGSSTIEVNVSVAPSSSDPDTSSTVIAPSGGARAAILPSVPPTTSADNTPPSVLFIAPSEGATVSGSFVTLSAKASDDTAVATVQFIIAGKKVGSALISPPYATVWDSTTLADGSYTLYAVAQDTAGNYGTSSVHITVKNR